MDEWLKLTLSGGVIGAVVVKLIEWCYQSYRRRADKSESADTHLDPFLKATDELVGKLVSLTKEDFKTLYTVNPSTIPINNNDFLRYCRHKMS